MAFRVRLPNGFELDLIDGTSTAVQREIRRNGIGNYERVVSATLLALCDRMDRAVFYDVGAHIGVYSAIVSAMFKTSVVFAFEPTPSTLEIARKIRDINKLPYYVVRRALSAQEGQLVFYLSPKAETSNSLNAAFRPGAEKTNIRATTMDRFLGGGAPAPNIVKIDVETHEPRTLFGAKKTIQNHKPWIICEILKKVNKSDLEAQLSWLSEAGYYFYNMNESFQWNRFSVDEIVVEGVEFSSRDWLFAPGLLDATFMESVHGWARRLSSSQQAETQP